MARTYRRLHVVARHLPDARRGKGAALNAGCEALRASLPPGVDTNRLIVGIVDADGRLDSNCLAMIAGPSLFGSAGVGAVQVKVRIAAGHIPRPTIATAEACHGCSYGFRTWSSPA